MAKLHVQSFPELLKYSGSLAAAGSISGSLPCAGYSQLVGFITSSGSSETGSGLCVQQSVNSGSEWDINSGSYATVAAFTSSCMIDIIGNAVKVRFGAGATDIDAVRALFQLKPVAGTAKMPDVDVDVISSGSVTVTSGSVKVTGASITTGSITAASVDIVKSGSVVITTGCLQELRTASAVITSGSIDIIKSGSVVVTSGSVKITAGSVDVVNAASVTNTVSVQSASLTLTPVSGSTTASGEAAVVASPATGALRNVVTDFSIRNMSGTEIFNMILRSGSARNNVGDRWAVRNASPGERMDRSFPEGREWRLDAGSPVILYGSSSPICYNVSYFTETA